MKKILILETSAFNGGNMGGSYLQANYYAKLLKEKGYASEIFLGESREDGKKRIGRVIKKIKESDLVIGFGTPLLGLYLQWLCFFLNKKGIYCIDTIIVPVSIMKDYIKRKYLLSKFLFLYALRLIIHKIILQFPPPRMNLTNIASCRYVKDKLSNSIFKNTADGYVYPRVKLKNGEKKRNIRQKSVLFYGALFRGRGVTDLLRACKILWKKNYQFRLDIYGWPVDSHTQKYLYREMKKGKDKNIMIKTGKEINILKKVDESSVVVLPFRYPCSFQTPYTLIEPMSMKVPVITTNVGSNSEWIKDGETGLICDKENIVDIAGKIEMILNDQNLVSKITNNAYRLLEKRFAEKDVILTTLEKLLHEN